MEQKKIWCRLLLCMGLAIVLFACARPPQKEVDEAKAAIAAAVTAGAETYAPEKLKKAKEMLVDAESNLKEKDYKQAKLLFIGARGTAEQAKVAAEGNKRRAQREATKLLDELRTTVDFAKTLVNRAVVLKAPTTRVVEFRAGCDSLDRSLSEVEKCVASDDYRGATERAQAAVDGGKELQRKIGATIDSLKARQEK